MTDRVVSMVIPGTMTLCLNRPLSPAVGWKSSPLQKMDVGFGVLRWTPTDTANSNTLSMGAKCISERIDGPTNTSSDLSATVMSSCTTATPRHASTPTTSTPVHKSRTTTTRSPRVAERGCGATPLTEPVKTTANTGIPFGAATCGSIQRQDIGDAVNVLLIERGRLTTAPIERGW